MTKKNHSNHSKKQHGNKRPAQGTSTPQSRNGHSKSRRPTPSPFAGPTRAAIGATDGSAAGSVQAKDENLAALASLAILKVNLDNRQQDYYAQLERFVSEALWNLKNDHISTALVQQELLGAFGLKIPLQVLESVLRRFVRASVLEKQDRQFRVIKPPQPKINSERIRATERQRLILQALANYAASEHDTTWTREQAAAAVMKYLSRFSIECLRLYSQRSALPRLQENGEHDVFIVHSFVRFAYEHSLILTASETASGYFDAIMEIVKGHMLANALICEDLASVQRRFTNVTFYLDTPFVLRLLGMDQETFQDAPRELVHLLSKLGGRLSVFDHTLDEVDNVLAYQEQKLKDPRGGNLQTQFLRLAGKQPTDISMLRQNVSRRLNEYNISRQQAPAYQTSNYRFQINEEALDEALTEEVRHNERARDYDIRSIRSIFVMRQDSQARDIEDCRAVLVTTNAALARVADAFGRAQDPPARVSPVISDMSLANIAWLKSPMESPELPRMEVIASCYAALKPPEEVWQLYSDEIEKLRLQGDITPEDHALMRSDKALLELAEERILASDDDWVKQTPRRILEQVKADLLAEQQAKSATDLALRDVAIAEEASKRSVAESDAQKLRDQEVLRIARINRIAERIAGVTSRILYVLLLTLLIGAAVIPFMPADDAGSKRPLFFTLALTILGLFSAFWGAAGGLLGCSAQSVVNNVESGVRLFVKKHLIRFSEGQNNNTDI